MVGTLEQHGSRASRIRLGASGLWLCGLLGALALAWCAAPAQAGEYTVWSCRGPDGSPISAAAWRTWVGDAASGEVTMSDDCSNRGSLRIEATPSGTIDSHEPVGEARFEPPPGTVISSYEIWRYVAANDGPATPPGENDYAAAWQEWYVGYPGLNEGCANLRLEPACSRGTAGVPLDESNRVAVDTGSAGGPAIEKLGFWVRCVRLGCEPPAAAVPALFELFRSAIAIADDQAPTVGRLEGALVEAAPVSGVAHLFVTADDVGGGVAAFTFSVDGGAPRMLTMGNGQGECEEPFSAPRPCPPTATRGFALDTASLAPGAHVVGGTVVDAAGNTTPLGPISFTVDRPPAAAVGQRREGPVGARPDNGTPAVEKPRLRLRPPRRPQPPGRPVRLRGTLSTPSGAPIAGARLGVELTELGSRRRGRTRSVRTDRRGRFTFEVGGSGARTVTVSYAPRLGGPPTRSARTLVRTRLGLRLRARPRRLRAGEAVRFLGRLRGAGLAARGANVEIQAVSGGRWTTVDTVTAGRSGAFSWTHRFRFVERNALFSFRAVVARTPGWPWPTVRSRRLVLPIAGSPR